MSLSFFSLGNWKGGVKIGSSLTKSEMSVRPLVSSWSWECRRQAQAENIYLRVTGVGKPSRATILDEITRSISINKEERKSKTKFSGSPKGKWSGIWNRTNVQTNWFEGCKKVTVIF